MLTKYLLLSDGEINSFTHRLTNFQNLLTLEEKGI